jgi:uncharacterized protein YbjT (DUF2867 family)
MVTILVLGGTGLLGAPTVRRRAADRFGVRVLSRRANAARGMFGPTVDVVDPTALVCRRRPRPDRLAGLPGR